MVSIVIPTYKRKDTLIRAIDSCLCQTYEDIEIIVVDDNDPDSPWRKKTEGVMGAYLDNPCVSYIKHERNMKGAEARNTGIAASKGKYITFLDDDDVLDREKIKRQVQALEEAGDDYGVVCCGVSVCNEESGKVIKRSVPRTGEDAKFDLLRLRGGMGTGSNPMFSREAVEYAKGFDISFLRHQDTEFVIRVLRKYKMRVIGDVLITKYESGHPNRPQIGEYAGVTEHFLETFKDDIMQYPEEKRNEIYRNNYHQIAIAAMDQKKPAAARRYSKKAAGYMKYDLRMRLGLLRHLISRRL